MTLSQQDLIQLHEATLLLLERVGVCVDCQEALDLLAQAGIRVDASTRRVFPRQEHVEAALATMPRGMTVFGTGGHPPVQLAGDHVSVMSGGGNLRVLNLAGEYESATWQHLRDFNRLLDALPNIHMCVNQVDPLDEPRDGFYRRLAAEMLLTCSKPICFQVGSAADVAAMLEMGVAIRGSLAELRRQPVFMIGLNSEPPLHISRDVTMALIAGCRAGIPCSVGCYAMMGITAPVTEAGSAVHINAIQLTTFILSQLVRAGAPVCYTSFSGSGDMRTLDPSIANPHATRLIRLASSLGRFYGLPVYGIALTDANAPDPQAACERAIQLQVSIDSGTNLIQGPTAHMDQMMLTSYVQAIIDNDIVGYVLAANQPVDISEEALALEATQEVVDDPALKDLKFSAHPHTVRHMRTVAWQPQVFNYQNFATWQRQGRRSVVDRATTIAREILDDHWPDPLPEAVVKEIRRIEAASL